MSNIHSNEVNTGANSLGVIHVAAALNLSRASKIEVSRPVQSDLKAFIESNLQAIASAIENLRPPEGTSPSPEYLNEKGFYGRAKNMVDSLLGEWTGGEVPGAQLDGRIVELAITSLAISYFWQDAIKTEIVYAKMKILSLCVNSMAASSNVPDIADYVDIGPGQASGENGPQHDEFYYRKQLIKQNADALRMEYNQAVDLKNTWVTEALISSYPFKDTETCIIEEMRDLENNIRKNIDWIDCSAKMREYIELGNKLRGMFEATDSPPEHVSPGPY